MFTGRTSAPVWAALGLFAFGAQAQSTPSAEPKPFVILGAPPKLIPPPTDEPSAAPTAPQGSRELERKRRALLTSRDAFAVPGENLGAPPIRFCVKGKCHGTYAEVAKAVHGGNLASAPVFCAPRKSAGKWDPASVHCSANWMDTLGKWKPWLPNGEPSSAPEEGEIPPYACYGSPHMLGKHMVVPAGGQAGASGFHCRKRLFRVLVTKAAKSEQDVNADVARMCTEMRGQVWGEKYKDINDEYQKWCRGSKGPKDKSVCLPANETPPGAKAPPLPFMLLSREELLHFFGHQELFCRADRPGLTHFLYNAAWAKTFTCAIPRGLIEAGPFEEGVQTCALTPFAGEEALQGVPGAGDHAKARLHCWQFNRSTCEEISREQKKEDLYRSNVFDVYDALREFRRTRNATAFSLYDQKDVEKLADFQDALAFSDVAKDEGTFGVREFCRFLDADRTKLQCGYTKQTMAQWYELRSEEAPAGCERGVCARGAFQRGYYCGLFSSAELFQGRPYWMCGIDPAAAGKKLLAGAGAICAGGARSRGFLSAKGDKGSLQCYERRFRWGESRASERVLARVDFAKMVETVWQLPTRAEWKQDVVALIPWVRTFGHTLGHRASMRQAVLDSADIPCLRDLRLPLFRTLPGFKDLVREVLSGERSPDAAWLRESYGTLKEVKGSACVLGKCAGDVISRVHELFARLDKARELLLRDAKAYADAVFTTARSAERLSRLEVHERARTDQAAARFKGNVFCVAADSKSPSGREEFVCASSPLVAAGAIERRLSPKYGSLDRQRNSVKMPWCYGGTAGMPLYGSHPIPALSEQGLMSPYYLDIPRAVLTYAPRKVAPPPAPGKRSSREPRRPLVLERLAGGGGGEDSFVASHLVSGVAARVGRVKARPPRKARYTSVNDMPAIGAPGNPNKLGTMKVIPGVWKRSSRWFTASSKANWLKCSGLQYSDEKYETWTADGMSQKVRATDAVSPPSSSGASAGATESAKIMQQVGGFVGKLVPFVLPKLSHASELVRNLGHLSSGFLDEWSRRIVDVGGKLWEEANKKIAELRGEIEKAETDVKEREVKVDTARDKLHQAELNAATAQGPAKEQAEAKRNLAKDAFEGARKEVKEQQSALRAKTREVETGIKQVCKAHQEVRGSGALLNGMLEDLSKQIVARVMHALDPNVRHLLAFGMRFVRTLLGPIAAAVISSLAGIPFVGSALAPVGQITYDLALNMLEDSVHGLLTGVVERIFATLLRPVITPIFKAAQEKVMGIAHGAFMGALGKFCSETVDKLRFSALPAHDRWIERALACSGRPLFDDVHRDAAVAHRRMIQTAAKMRREVATYSRDIANGYLARHGLSYDEWMAAVGRDAQPVLVARAAAIRRELEKTAGTLRGQLRKK